MRNPHHTSRVRVKLEHIRQNYRALCRVAEPSGSAGLEPGILPGCPGAEGALARERQLAWQGLIAVVKADAYGHGNLEVSRALREEGAALFACGSVREAAFLREGLLREGDSDADALPGIIALLGLMGEKDAALAAENGIIPVIHCFQQVLLLEKMRMPLAVALKCNSGMNRLGFGMDDMPELARRLARLPAVRPVLAISHLASADTEEGRQQTHSQAVVFARMLEYLRRSFPLLAASLGNTAGTFFSGEIEAVLGAHICRPGLGLYGSNPFAGTCQEELGARAGLLPAMSVSAPLLAVRDLPAGAGIGYGHTFRANKNTRVGIVGIGYADLFPRSMSNHGQLCVNGGRAPVLGNVSMQMTAVDLKACADAKPGDEAWVLGGPYDAALKTEELAALWGTISYEVFCLLGLGQREYI